MSTENTIFIFEFVSGGGFNQIVVPPHLFCEGYAMLRSIILDFKCMNFNILSTIDSRISFLSKYLGADICELINSDNSYKKIFINNIKKCEYCFIIAPEFSNILYELTEIALQFNKIVLSVDLRGIKLGTSKLKTFNYFTEQNILTPRTCEIPRKGNGLDNVFIIDKMREFNCPIILKPEDGVGSEGIFYIDNEQMIKNIINIQGDNIGDRNYILQEFINGVDLSASFIGKVQENDNMGGLPIILGINSQYVQIKQINKESEYVGGTTPAKLYEACYKDLIELVKNSKIPLSGYFGIDFVRTQKNKNYYIEINPRLTTSYIGIRNVINLNPAKLIFEAKVSNEVYGTPYCTHHSSFYRMELQFNSTNSNKDPYENEIPALMELIPEIMTPPISNKQLGHGDDRSYSCFISTKEKTEEKSLKRQNEIREIFKKRNFLVFK